MGVVTELMVFINSVLLQLVTVFIEFFYSMDEQGVLLVSEGLHVARPVPKVSIEGNRKHHQRWVAGFA